jgi:hypothetical protein
MRLSRTVKSANRLLRWNERAMPILARLVTSRRVTSRPASRMVPELGRRLPASRLK